MKKYIITIITLVTLVPLLIEAQTFQTIRITDWNDLPISGFYESTYEDNHQNIPATYPWFWGLSIGHSLNPSISTKYNAQIAFSASWDEFRIPDVYVRSTNQEGKGIWAKILTDKGDQEIAGKLRAREISVEITAGADHIFHESYELKPLSEVEQFIKANQHLPEIPSEKQMQEEGLNINEFQIKLLQKIEELTLYTIELKKEVDQLKTQNK